MTVYLKLTLSAEEVETHSTLSEAASDEELAKRLLAIFRSARSVKAEKMVLHRSYGLTVKGQP